MDTTFRPSLLSDSQRGRWLSSTLAMALHGTVAVAAVVGLGFDPPPVDAEPHVVVELVAVAAPVPVAAPEPPAPMPPAPPTPATKPAPPRPLPKVLPKAAAPVKSAPPKVSEPAPATPSIPDAVAEAPAADTADTSGRPATDAPPTAHAAALQQAYSPPVGRAGYLSNPRPAYPMLARKRGWEGMVTLLVEVAADGHPVSVEIKRSSGHSVLDNCAAAAVRQWQFQPARRGGTAVAASVEVPIRFDLQEGT